MFSTRLNTRTNNSTLLISLYSLLDSTLELITSTTHLSVSNRLYTRTNNSTLYLSISTQLNNLLTSLTIPASLFTQSLVQSMVNYWTNNLTGISLTKLLNQFINLLEMIINLFHGQNQLILQSSGINLYLDLQEYDLMRINT